MKIIVLSIMLLFISCNVFADNRISTTTTAYNATTRTATVIKYGDARVYSANFVASSAGGYFIILNATSNTTGSTFNDVKAEGKEATSLNSQFQDFSNNPLELSTGLTVVVENGTLILRYE